MDPSHIHRSIDLMIQLLELRLKSIPNIDNNLNQEPYHKDLAPVRVRRAKIEDLGIIED